MSVLETRLDPRSETFQHNRADMLALLGELDRLLAQAAAGGGEREHDRLRKRGKLPLRERIALVLDRDTAFLEISPLAAWRSEFTVGSGFVVGVGVISGVECVIMGHDPSVRAGAFNAFAGKKLLRGLEIARTNRMPFVQFVESAGADLRGSGGDQDPEASLRRELTHFGESGRMFHDITDLSKRGIPTVSVVFGASTAGGAYQPGMSDYNILIRGNSKVFLGGPPLVKMATGEDADEESLGGADMHCTQSGLGDYLAEDERDGIRLCREVVGHLNWRKRGPGPTLPSDPPVHDAEGLLGIVSKDLRQPFDIREVIARIVDGSRFEDFKPLYGATLVTGWASIHGFPIGIIGNNGVLFSESAQKAAQFIQLCNQIDVPLLFLNNITGFMVGTDYEQGGITKDGAKMINALSNSTVPHITIIVGASYGAGNFAMGGRAFGTNMTFTWPTAKVAVMGGKQMAGVMATVQRAAAQRKGEPFDEEASAKRSASAEYWAEERAQGLFATSRIVDDGMIDPRDTRTVVGIALSACHNNEIKGTREFGTWRM
jgi:acetyl-CoA carboxylase carboxyltransferase component